MRRFAIALFWLVIFLAASVYYFAKLHDQALNVTAESVSQIRALKQAPKFRDLPGVDTKEEIKRNESNLNELLERLETGVQANPRKRWVIEQMQPTVERMYLEDTEARERFIDYLERVNGLLGIQSTNGAFAGYRIFF